MREQGMYLCQVNEYVSCFDDLNNWLTQNEESFNLLLKNLKERNRVKNYKSIPDFLLCEIMPEYKHTCRKYYQGKGKPLDEDLGQKEIEKLDRKILKTITLLLAQLRNQQIV